MPRKPHPFGNEYHTVECGLTNILYQMEIVEGKDQPAEYKDSQQEKELGKTGAMMMRILKPIVGTAKVVILDSGFCVLSALVALRKAGVYASAVIKKRRFWPKLIPGKAIDEKMAGAEVGETASLHGELDNVKYDVFCMKEPAYTMKLMSTYGGLTIAEDQHEVWRHYEGANKEMVDKSFKYAEPFANHYLFRHCIDDHNNLRHQTPSLEETWKTHRWPCRVFAFLLVVSKVNA